MSHTTGILLAIRRAGFKVALVASVVPPAQLLAAADDVDVIEPSPPRSRVTRRLAKLSTNARFRRAALAVGIRRRPQFVYQRNDYLLAAGADVAARLGIPLVLEWNCSEVWVNAHWRRPGPLDAVVRPVVEPLAVSFESGTVLAAAVIAAVSRPAADMALERGASPERVMVVPNGVDLGVIPGTPLRRGHTDAAATRIGWIGSFGPWHGVEVLIRALALLPPPIHLTLIGEGIERESCVALARSLGVDDRIEWTGRLGHGSALARLAACDVLVSPHVPLPDTPFFGSPTKIFEYMALGKPIVASRLEQLGELLEDGRTARLVTPGDPAELAQAILDVITSADQGRGLGTEARREVEAQHTWDHRAVAILRKVGWRSVEPSSDPSGGTWPCDVSLP